MIDGGIFDKLDCHLKLGSDDNRAHCLLGIKIYKALNKKLNELNQRMAWVVFERLRIQTSIFGEEIVNAIQNEHYFNLI